MKKEVDFNLLYDEEKKNLVGLLIENNFDEIYEPLTTESLRFFVPLNGACLIDYQLHFFKQNNIKKIYVVVTHHEKELQHYIEKFQKSKKRYNDLDIEIIKLSKKVKTLGDALRDFKKCVEIYQDILLLLSDTIPIANIKEIIKAHFVNKEKCKNQIMTLILSHCSDENKSHNDDFVIAYDNFSFKLLLFEPLKNKNYLILTSEIFDEVKPKDGKKGATTSGVSGGGKKDQKASLCKVGEENKEYHTPTINFSTSTNSIIISYDLVMPNIFIITPQVFKLFEENFDYQCMRKDFIYNILKQEIKIEEIYVHSLNNDYNYTECNQIITTLTDFRIYFKFFKTLIERNVHPFLANSSHLLPDLPKFIFCEPGLYKAKNAIIDDSCKLLKIVLVENYAEISEKTFIENSVICKNCKIGKNVKIVNSIIGKNSIVKDNVTIISSFISENNVINEGAYIDECCVLGKNMNIPADTKIGKYTRLSAFKHLKGQLKGHRRSKEQDDHSAEEREKKDCSADASGGEAHTMQFEQESVTKENAESALNESTHKGGEEAAAGEKQEEVKEEEDVKEVDEEVKAVKEDVKEVDEEVKEVKEEVNEEKEEVNEEKEEVNEEVSEMKEEVNEEKEEMTEVKEVIEENGKVNEEKEVTEEKEEVKEVKVEVNEVGEEVNEVKEEVNEAKEEVIEKKEEMTEVKEVKEENEEVKEVHEEVIEEKEEANEIAMDAKELKEEANEIATDAKELKEEANEIATDAKELKEEANEIATDAKEEKEEANEIATDAKEEKEEAHAMATDAKELADENGDVAAEEPFELSKFIVKTRYSEEQLRLFSLIGDAENYGKIKMTSFSEYDSEEESDEDSVYSTSKNYSTLSDTNVSDKEDESNRNSTANMSDINNHFDKINLENEKNSFVKEISLLCKEAIEKPQHMSHKILEMKSFRLSLNYTDLDVIISFFPIVWDFINSMEFDKDTWVENFDEAKLDLLFSSFLLDDQLYYETIYGLILDFSKKEFLANDVKNNVYGSEKLCAAFEYIYHSDIFEFNYFNEWISKNEEDEYLANNKRLKAFAEWLAEE
ncbi:W2 domain-containing protein, putative [Plasmodium vivax]|nr:W2 domain-containing protein, putative [Plasmodium vivax]